MFALGSGSVLPVYYNLWCGRPWLGLYIFHASSWIETKEVMAEVGFLAFVLFLVQYENEASGSLGSMRKMEESGGSMDTKKTQGTDQLLPAKLWLPWPYSVRE